MDSLLDQMQDTVDALDIKIAQLMDERERRLKIKEREEKENGNTQRSNKPDGVF